MDTIKNDDERGVLVYRITNLVNGKLYYGVTLGAVAKRWSQHLSRAKCELERQSALHNAIRKYGNDQFKIETVYAAVDAREAQAVERGLIAQDGTLTPRGYNLTTGGEEGAGSRLSQAARSKRIGRVGGMLGKKHTVEAIDKIRQTHLGQKRDPEVGRKISAAKKGKPSKLKGRKLRPEIIERKRQAHRAWWALQSPERRAEILQGAWKARGINRFHCETNIIDS